MGIQFRVLGVFVEKDSLGQEAFGGSLVSEAFVAAGH
jgi:hypothetical protein